MVGYAPSYRQPSRLLAVFLPLLVVLIAFLVVLQLRSLFMHGSLPSPALDRQAQSRPIAPAGNLAEDEKATIALFKQTSKSVVHINTREVAHDIINDEDEVELGSSSGFIWDDKGHIVTNFHVVENADHFKVTLADQSTWDAVPIGAAPDRDVAVLRIDAKASRLQPLLVGTSRDLQVGQKVFAIGNPFGLDQTLTTGIISGVGRQIKARTGRVIDGVIQTDAAINPGNSGGPLLDSRGRLIGMNTAIYSPSGASAGIGFAIPVDTIQQVTPELLRHGRIVHPTIDAQFFPDSLVHRLVDRGVLIARVEPDGAAAKAGLRPTRRSSDGDIQWGDLIVAIDDKPVEGLNDLLAAFEKHSAGDQVKLSIIRDADSESEQRLDVHVTLAAPKSNHSLRSD